MLIFSWLRCWVGIMTFVSMNLVIKKTASVEPHDYLRVQIENKSQNLLSVLFLFVAACK